MKRTIGYTSVAVTLIFGIWLSVAGAGEAKEKPAIEQILDFLLQRGQISPEEYRSLQEKAKKEQESAVLAGIERVKPFLRSADDNFRFLIRRARLNLDGRFYRWIGFRIEAEFTEGVGLKDAYLDLAFLPEARLRLGQFKVPFSLEELTSSLFIDFVERSIINTLAPMRDRGIMLYGDLMQGAISYYLGGFNGTGEDTSDNNGDKDLAFRLAFAPFRSSDSFWLKGLQFAGDVTWGNEDSSTSPPGQTGARTPNRFTFFAA
jgi:phosphate-selective porin